MPGGLDEHQETETSPDPLDFENPALPPPLDMPPDHPPLLAEETPPRHLDDMDRIVCHEDFPQLLALATKLKGMRESMDRDAPPTGEHQMDPNQVISAVSRIQDQFVSDQAQDKPVVRRGVYPLTDSMLDEMFQILQNELKRCDAWYEQRRHAALLIQKTPAKRRKTDGDSIAVKYSKWQTDILMGWMIANTHHPFPDVDQIKELGERTGLTHSQVVNWTTNIRKRNLKATVENGKKPHHFLDFMFLAQDRDRRQAQGLPMTPIKTPAARRKANTKASPVASAPTSAAFRPYGTPMYYPPPHNGYHAYYPPPFPPPPYGYQQHQQHHPSPAPPPEEDEWERKLRSVSESFDAEDIPNPVMSAEEENPEALMAFAQFWKGGEDDMELVEDTAIKEEDAGQHFEASLAYGKRQREPSMEMVDLDGEDGQDVFDFVKEILEV